MRKHRLASLRNHPHPQAEDKCDQEEEQEEGEEDRYYLTLRFFDLGLQ